MSTLKVEVCEVSEVLPHPNADSLEILLLKGWNVVAKKGLVTQGDPVVFFPPDSVMSEELADRLGIRKYLNPVKDDGVVKGYRVSAKRLRGEPSFGTIEHAVPAGFSVGDDVTEHYGVTKYEPPAKDPHFKSSLVSSLKAHREPDHPKFHRYTDVENIRNYKNVLQEGEEVFITEKLHGTNVRVGKIDGEWVAGSHKFQRREKDSYWLPLDDPNLTSMIDSFDGDVIVFGEIFGSGVQDMAYGLKDGAKAYRVFDISVGGRYMDADLKHVLCSMWNVPCVPILYQGPYSWEKLKELTDGPTTMCSEADAGKFKGREGVVVTPTKERFAKLGRVILKSISADYLARKGGTDGH